MTHQTTLPARMVAVACVMLCATAGCLHPNIPSVRGDIPVHSNHAAPAMTGNTTWHDGSPRLPGGAVECPPDDPNDTRIGVLADHIYGQGAPQEPAVPWPRFHPLPTEPVF